MHGHSAYYTASHYNSYKRCKIHSNSDSQSNNNEIPCKLNSMMVEKLYFPFFTSSTPSLFVSFLPSSFWLGHLLAAIIFTASPTFPSHLFRLCFIRCDFSRSVGSLIRSRDIKTHFLQRTTFK